MFLKKLRSLRHTLALRLTVWYAGIFVASCVLAFMLVYVLMVSIVQERTDADLEEDIDEFAVECVDACRQARQVVRELDELLDTGFRGRETDRVRTMVREIDVTERRCDEIEAAIRARLYSLEAGLSPVDVVFMYRVIEWIGDLANHAERVGHRLDQLLAS